MPVQTAALDRAANGIANNVTALSLHTTNGGSDGSGELTGGSYAKRNKTTDFTYTAASGTGVATLTASVVFQGPGTTSNVTHLGFWDGSTWLGSAQLSASKTIGPGDTLTITAAPITVTAA